MIHILGVLVEVMGGGWMELEMGVFMGGVRFWQPGSIQGHKTPVMIYWNGGAEEAEGEDYHMDQEDEDPSAGEDPVLVAGPPMIWGGHFMDQGRGDG